MKRALLPLLLFLGAALPAPAGAATLPTTSVPGVTAQRSGAKITVKVGATGAAARVRRALSGHRVVIRCTDFGPPQLGAPSSAREGITLRVPRGFTTITVGVSGRAYDACTLAATGHGIAVIVAADRDGRIFLAETRTAATLDALLTAAGDVSDRAHRSTWPSSQSIASSSHGTIVALDSPAATPPAGKLGYFSDAGHHVAAVAVAPSGRRLFLERNGDVTRTNTSDLVIQARLLAR